MDKMKYYEITLEKKNETKKYKTCVIAERKPYRLEVLQMVLNTHGRYEYNNIENIIEIEKDIAINNYNFKNGCLIAEIVKDRR